MNRELEKIDEVVKRTNVSYKEAKKALEKTDWDVIDAVIYIEENCVEVKCDCNAKKKGEEIISQVKKIVEKGNVIKITIKKDNEVILNIPITAGAVGMVFAPILSLVGLTAALITECTIEITKVNGEVIYLNDEVDKSVNKVKDEFENFKNKFS